MGFKVGGDLPVDVQSQIESLLDLRVVLAEIQIHPHFIGLELDDNCVLVWDVFHPSNALNVVALPLVVELNHQLRFAEDKRCL